MIYLPDISHHHPVLSWEKLEHSCPFLITKATEGMSYVDPTLKDFIRECEKRGIPYWLYTFLRRGNELDQTKFMVSVCSKLVGKNFVGYILDIESENAEQNCIAALDWLKNKCEKQMIYTMYSQLPKYKKLIEGRPSTCAWWEARYGKNDGVYSSSYPCHVGADLHQYTDHGSVPGLQGNIDLNRITGKIKDEVWFRSPKKEDGLAVGDLVEVTVADQIKIMSGSSKYDKELIGYFHKGAKLRIKKLNATGSMAKVAENVWVYTKWLEKVK